MAKLLVKKENGELTGTLTVEYNLGKIHQDKNKTVVNEDGTKVTSVISAMHVDSMVSFYEQLVFEKADGGTFEEYKEALDTLYQLKLNQVIGIKQTPLVIEDGKVVGVAEEVEVEFEE